MKCLAAFVLLKPHKGKCPVSKLMDGEYIPNCVDPYGRCSNGHLTILGPVVSGQLVYNRNRDRLFWISAEELSIAGWSNSQFAESGKSYFPELVLRMAVQYRLLHLPHLPPKLSPQSYLTRHSEGNLASLLDGGVSGRSLKLGDTPMCRLEIVDHDFSSLFFRDIFLSRLDSQYPRLFQNVHVRNSTGHLKKPLNIWRFCSSP
ncbi:hypothetical protein K432DRAFT_395121 [Lepidopterella palustris CBS 459.81]|uniref:Uncharacterized protein n=1 Tax=Lepidopterella palustris CBS 459.81 TaxID=1314670 RepID=A0A8E2E694_9PEZI|nr:hypothetical protein K432DRAFT_395121 [Lepidopterella palustris CBS 459.81]